MQLGVSKKSNKPYAMVTLEDLDGSVQILCMNENYDKYRPLFVPNKALLIVGEVNNGEDKPKIFPQEIMPLEDAPRKYTKQVHFRLHTAHLKPENLTSVHELAAQHPGKCPLFLCFHVRPVEARLSSSRRTNEILRHCRRDRSCSRPKADQRFGDDTYYVKVDTTPPERTPYDPGENRGRQWERRGVAQRVYPTALALRFDIAVARYGCDSEFVSAKREHVANPVPLRRFLSMAVRAIRIFGVTLPVFFRPKRTNSWSTFL